MSMKARDNPFRTERLLSIRYRFQDSTAWQGLIERLAQLEYRAAIVGPEGFGKTTLQEDLDTRLQAEGRQTRWLRLNRNNRSIASELIEKFLHLSSTSEILFVDGAEQIKPMAWTRFLKKTVKHAGLVITTHKPGRLPTLYECHVTPDLLKNIVATLSPKQFENRNGLLDEIFTCYRGNIRLCLLELYDRVELIE